MTVLCTELRSARAELSDLMSQCDGSRGHTNTSTVERDPAGVDELTAMRNLQDAQAGRGTLYYNATTARRRANRIEAALSNFCTAGNGCKGASNLCSSKTRSVVSSRLGHSTSTHYEGCLGNLMALRGDNDCNFYMDMVAVHGQPHCLRSSVDDMQAATQIPSSTSPPYSDSGGADTCSSSFSAS